MSDLLTAAKAVLKELDDASTSDLSLVLSVDNENQFRAAVNGSGGRALVTTSRRWSLVRMVGNYYGAAEIGVSRSLPKGQRHPLRRKTNDHPSYDAQSLHRTTGLHPGSYISANCRNRDPKDQPDHKREYVFVAGND